MYLDIYKNKRVLVTGTTGFKGSWLSFWLNKLGAKVVGIGLKPEKDSFIFHSLSLNKRIKQYYINVEKNDYKFDTLCDLYGILTISQSIIYCNSRRIVDNLTNRLVDNNFGVSYIHGEMTPKEREITMADFRNGKTRVLVSTDLLSRGIDVQQVSVVINYDIPLKIESYLHRIGRSGRYGRKGVGINFVTNYDEQRILNIERYYATQIDNLPADINNLLAT